jgi:hypothetical protein
VHNKIEHKNIVAYGGFKKSISRMFMFERLIHLLAANSADNNSRAKWRCSTSWHLDNLNCQQHTSSSGRNYMKKQFYVSPLPRNPWQILGKTMNTSKQMGTVTLASARYISCSTNRFPGQTRRPQPKGTTRNGLLRVTSPSCSQRSGRNSCADVKFSSSWHASHVWHRTTV